MIPWRVRLAALVVPAVGMVVLLALVGFSRLNPEARTLDTFGPAPTFGELIDQERRPASASDLQGKVVVADFIYTSCTDVCPILSGRMRMLQNRLRQEKLLDGQVQLLSFTVDPARDTPEVLQAYADRFHADPSAWRFLTGPEEVVLPLLVGGFHLGVELIPSRAGPTALDDSPYTVMHSDRFVLIDRDWRIRAYYDSYEVDPDRVVDDVRQLVR